MHPFSILTVVIFVAGYITARWDLVTRLYELAIFAVDHGVVVSTFLYSITRGKITHELQTRTAKGIAFLSFFFFLIVIPCQRLAAQETNIVFYHLLTSWFCTLIPPIASALHGRWYLRPRTTETPRLVLTQ